MAIEIGLSKGQFNTKFAPLAVLAARFAQQQTLKPLEQVDVGIGMKRVVILVLTTELRFVHYAIRFII